MDPKMKNNYRSSFGYLDVVGALGGVFELTIAVLGLFLFPISKHSYILKFISKLYFAKTRYKNLFQQYEEGWVIQPQKIRNEESDEHHFIKLSCCKSTKLFYYNYCCTKGYLNNKPKSQKLMSLFQLGHQRLEKEIHLERIIQNTRITKFLFNKLYNFESMK